MAPGEDAKKGGFWKVTMIQCARTRLLERHSGWVGVILWDDGDGDVEVAYQKNH